MKWEYKIIISDLTKPYRDRDDITEEEAKKLAKQIAERVRQSKAYQHLKSQLEEVSLKFEEEATNQEELNEILNELYDIGDSYKIWIDNLPI